MSVGRRLLLYLRPHAGRCAWAVAAMVGVAAFNGASILVLKPIVDKVLIAKSLRTLGFAVAAVPLIMALKTVASYAQNYLTSWLGQRVTQEIREDLFRHLHALPLEYYASHESGEILSRVTGDLAVAQSALTSVPLYLIRDSMTVLVLIGSLFYLDWKFALLALIGVPLTAGTLLVLSRKMRASSHRSQLMMGRIYQRFQESLQAMAVIKAFNYEQGAIEKFQEENASFFEPMMSYLRATALSAPLMELCGGFVAALILYFGGCEVILGHMTPGAFFAFLGAFFAAYAPLKNLARSNSELQRALASAERLFQVLDEPATDPGSQSSKTARFQGLTADIRLESVFFRYPGRDDYALEGVDFRLEKGSRTAIVGPSGSGKTTVLQLLLRLHDPTGGRLLFDGNDSRGIDPRSLRARIGLVSQDTALFHDTVLANVALSGKADARLVEEACRAAGAHEFIQRLPQGYQTRLGDWGLALSPGQRQRLAIARVLAKDPEILVLDEATASLDNRAEAEILSALERLFERRTVVFIAHKLSSLPKVDQIVVLNQGRLAESGDHASLMARGGLYRRLYDLHQEAPPAAASA